VLLIAPAAIPARAAEPAPGNSAIVLQDSSSKTEKLGKKRYSHVNDFLIRGTVFTEKAFSFPGVQVKFRKEGEKKYKWETYTNSRGEFAQRVPEGANYEILVHVKGFADQTRTIEAKGGGNEETTVFRMQPIGETRNEEGTTHLLPGGGHVAPGERGDGSRQEARSSASDGPWRGHRQVR